MTEHDEDCFDPMSHLGLGVLDGLVVIYAYGIPVLLDGDQARDLSKHLLEAADLIDWHEEIYGEES